MQYLKVKKDKRLYDENMAKFHLMIKDELLTLKEFYNLKKMYYNISCEDIEPIELNKNRTAFFFGARIELKGGC